MFSSLLASVIQRLKAIGGDLRRAALGSGVVYNLMVRNVATTRRALAID